MNLCRLLRFQTILAQITIVHTLHSLDVSVTRRIQNLELGLFEVIAVPGCVCFGWLGIMFGMLPLVVTLDALTRNPGIAVFSTGAAIWLTLITLAIGQTINRFAKQTFQRKRPSPPSPRPQRMFKLYKHISMTDPDGPSFPSGDTMGAGCIGGALLVYYSNPAFLVIPLLGSLGRQYYFFHYFMDTLAGGMIGVGAAFLADGLVGGHANLSYQHILPAIPVFILMQKAAKVYGRWNRSR